MTEYLSPSALGNTFYPFPSNYPFPSGFGGDPAGGVNSDSAANASQPLVPSTSLDTKESLVIADTVGVERADRRQKSKDRLIVLLRDAGLSEEAEKVGKCGKEFTALKCSNDHVHQPVPTFRCGHRLCPDCGRNRQRKALRKLIPALAHLHRLYPQDRWVHVVLTTESSFSPLLSVVTDFKNSFRKFRRMKTWKDHVRGGVGGFEETWSDEFGHHFHCHLLLLRKEWWSHAEIMESWSRATAGRGEIVFIGVVKDFRKGVIEVTKYISKPTDINSFGPDQVRQFSELRGVKFSECYGELRGIIPDPEDDSEEMPVLEVGDPCPRCGERLSNFIVSRHLLRDLVSMTCEERGPPGSKILLSLFFL